MSLPRPVTTGDLALVTGATTGIGRATALALADEGYRVIVSGRRAEAVRAVVDAVPDAAADRVIGLQLDIAHTESVSSLPDRLPDGWREIDILVNNAGHDRGGRRRLHNASPEDFLDVLGTNVVGTIHLTHALIRGMVERDHGHVVNVSSVQATYLLPGTPVYTAAKHAIHGFSEVLRLDYANTGVRVTEVMPGAVKSNFALNRWSDPERAEAFYAAIPSMMDPEDIAAGIVYALAQPAHVDVSLLVVQAAGKRHA